MTDIPQAIQEKIDSFVAAIKADDVAKVRELLADPALKANVDGRWFSFDSTAMIKASNRRSKAMVELLLENGADVNARSTWWAGGFGVLPCDDDDWAEYLIGQGAKVDIFAAAGHDKLDILREMLESDPSLVNALGGDGKTPLHFARSVETCRLLLENGANIDTRDIDHSSTPAQYAINSRDKLRFLIEQGATSEIFITVALGDLQTLRQMVAADPGVLNSTANSGPHNPTPAPGDHIYVYLIGNHAIILLAAALANQPEMIDYLIESGMDPNARGGYDNCTPLHSAAWQGNIEAADTLLKYGADIEVRSGELHKNTPLGWAVASGKPKMVKFLLSRGAKLNDWYLKNAKENLDEIDGRPMATKAEYEEIIDILTNYQP